MFYTVRRSALHIVLHESVSYCPSRLPISREPTKPLDQRTASHTITIVNLPVSSTLVIFLSADKEQRGALEGRGT